MQLLQQLLLQRLLLLLLQLHGREVGAGELHALACMHAGLISQDSTSFAFGSSPRLLLMRCVAAIAMTPDMARHGQQKGVLLASNVGFLQQHWRPARLRRCFGVELSAFSLSGAALSRLAT